MKGSRLVFLCFLLLPVMPQTLAQGAPLRVNVKLEHTLDGDCSAVSAGPKCDQCVLSLEGAFRMFDLTKHTLGGKLPGSGNRVCVVEKGKAVLVGDAEKSGISRLTLDGKVLGTFDLPGAFMASENAPFFATARGNTITASDPATGRVLATWSSKDKKGEIRVYAVSWDGEILARCLSDESQDLIAWRPQDKPPPALLPYEDSCTALAAAPAPSRAVAIGYGRKNYIDVYSARFEKRLHRLKGHEGAGDVTGLAYSPDGRFLFSLFGFNERAQPEVIVWDVKGGYRQAARVVVGTGWMYGIYALPDSSGFITYAGNDDKTKFWKVTVTK